MAGHAEYAKVAPVVNKSGKTFTRAEVAQHKKVCLTRGQQQRKRRLDTALTLRRLLLLHSHSKETSGSLSTLPSSESASGSNIRHSRSGARRADGAAKLPFPSQRVSYGTSDADSCLHQQLISIPYLPV